MIIFFSNESLLTYITYVLLHFILTILSKIFFFLYLRQKVKQTEINMFVLFFEFFILDLGDFVSDHFHLVGSVGLLICFVAWCLADGAGFLFFGATQCSWICYGATEALYEAWVFLGHAVHIVRIRSEVLGYESCDKVFFLLVHSVVVAHFNFAIINSTFFRFRIRFRLILGWHGPLSILLRHREIFKS